MGFFSEYSQVNKLLQQKQQVVFYAESRHYYQYFEKLITDLLAVGNVNICYITSDANDPLLVAAPAPMKVIHVKWMLAFLFSKIRADVMILTMPDLDNFLFKRSAGVSTYIYMFHAAVSTHQQYRKDAFFNYDVIFCTGDYQAKEIRKAETAYGQQEKQLVSYGYPLIEAIKTKSKEAPAHPPTILVAPSWFKGCIFETCFEELIQQLALLPYTIVLRSHPEYEKREKKKFRQIQKLIGTYSNIVIDNFPNVIDRLPVSDLLITDRSGIAFEFAFGLGKPVLFIDTVLKQTNPGWQELDMEPVENEFRSELGISILPSELSKLSQKIKQLETMSDDFKKKIEILEKKMLYNSDTSYLAGLKYVQDSLTGS